MAEQRSIVVLVPVAIGMHQSVLDQQAHFTRDPHQSSRLCVRVCFFSSIERNEFEIK